MFGLQKLVSVCVSVQKMCAWITERLQLGADVHY